MSETKPYIGGQAVIEGVMMRAPGCMSVAVRRPDESLAIVEGPVHSRSGAWKWPGLRGVVTLFESLSLGYRALQFSAEQQLLEEEEGASPGPTATLTLTLTQALARLWIALRSLTLALAFAADGPEAEDPEGGDPEGAPAPAARGAAAPSGGGSGKAAMVLSTLFALGLFIALPQLLTWLVSRSFGVELDVQDPLFHILTGGFKLLIFTAYLLLISQMEDVRRVFQYHGAEHKTIFAYESGLPLTVENVRAQSTLHPRCGTTFLVVVVVVSIVVGSVATPLILPDVHGALGQVLTLLLRIALLPLIAAISFEFQRFSARYCTRGPLRVLLWPGFLFQKITTREPDDDQIEIAIAAMETAIWREEASQPSQAADPSATPSAEPSADLMKAPHLFPSFESFQEELPRMTPSAL